MIARASLSTKESATLWMVAEMHVTICYPDKGTLSGYRYTAWYDSQRERTNDKKPAHIPRVGDLMYLNGDPEVRYRVWRVLWESSQVVMVYVRRHRWWHGG